MVRFKGLITNTYMQVADERAEEYRELGYIPAPESDAAIEPAEVETPKEEPIEPKKEAKKRKTTRTTKKK